MKDGKLVLPDGVSYRLLVLPDDPSMTLTMLRRLDELVRTGAVVVGRTKPTFSPSLADDSDQPDEFRRLADTLWDKGKVISDKTVAEVLGKLAPLDFEARSSKDLVRHIHRRDQGEDIWFLASSGNTVQRFDAVFRTQAEGSPVLMDAVTGETRGLPEYRVEDGRTVVPMVLEPRQSFFVVFGEGSGKPAGEKNFPEFVPLQELTGSWTVRFRPKTRWT